MDNFGFTPRTENQSFPVSPLRKSISNTPFSWVMTRGGLPRVDCASQCWGVVGSGKAAVSYTELCRNNAGRAQG